MFDNDTKILNHHNARADWGRELFKSLKDVQ